MAALTPDKPSGVTWISTVPESRLIVATSQNRNAVLIAAATAFSLLGDQALYSVLPVYYDSLGIAAFEVGILLSANRWIRLVTNEIAHRMLEHTPQRLLFCLALFLGALTTLAYAATHSFTILLLARILWGLAWSFIRHLGLLSIMHDTPVSQAGRTMGLYNGISRVGSVAGLFGGALVVDWLGFVPAMLVLGIVSLLAVPLGFVGLHPGNILTKSTQHEGEGVWSYRILGFAMGVAGPGLVMATLGAVVATYVDGLASAATLTGGVLAVRFLLDAAAAPRLGAVTDTLGVRKAATAFFVVGGLALVAAWIQPPLIALLASVIVFFVCGTALQAGIAGTVGKQGSQAFARYVTAADFGAASGPLAGWIALELFASETVGLALAAVVYLVAASVAAASLPRLGRRLT